MGKEESREGNLLKSNIETRRGEKTMRDVIKEFKGSIVNLFV